MMDLSIFYFLLNNSIDQLLIKSLRSISQQFCVIGNNIKQILHVNQKMLSKLSFPSVLSTLLIILIVYIAYRIIKSFRFKNYYAKYAASLGFKIYEHKYCLFGSQMYSQFKRQQIQNGDANYHYKHQLSNYDIIVSNLVFRTMLQLQNPQIVKQFFMKATEGYYVKADFGLAHLRRLIETDNLLLSQGYYWKNRRKILSTVFNYDFIVQQIPKIQDITKLAFINLQKQHSNQDQIKVNIGQILLTVFSTVILQCFFKKDELNYIGQQKTVSFINDLLVKMTSIARSKQGILLGVKVAQLGLTQKNREINNAIDKFRTIAKQIVQKRIKQIKQSQKSAKPVSQSRPGDMIQALMRNNQINLTSSSKQGQISINSIINQFLTFFLAGSETTLSFTRMMIYRLADNPQILKKVGQQFDKELKTEQVTLDQLKNLKYFQKVQKQTLRMDSSVGAVFTRVAQKDHYLGNLKIYKGMTVNVRLRAIHYKQQFYKNANQFNPDRWDNQNSINTYAYIPFSAGGRACIGKHLSLLENKIFMAELLRRYKHISIDKKMKDIKFKISTLYGPEQLTTTLKKN